MQKIVMHSVELDFKQSSAFEIEIQEGAQIKQTLIQLRPKSIIQTNVIRGNEEPAFDIVPVVVFMINPDNPKKKYKYFVLPPEQIAEAGEGCDLEYCGTFMHPKGYLLHLIQEIENK